MATYTKGKMDGFLFFCCKMDMDMDIEDGPNSVRGWFGFADLNPKGFVIVAKM